MSISIKYTSVKSWLDLHIKQNGQKMITGVIGNEAYSKVLSFAKDIWDTRGVANGLAGLDENGKVPGSQLNVAWGDLSSKPTTLSGFGITDAHSVQESEFAIVGGSPDTLTLNCNSKQNLIATKVGGGAIVADDDFTIALENDSNIKYIQGWLQVTSSLQVTLPAEVKTSSSLVLAAGYYQFVFASNGAYLSFTLSDPET